MGDKFDSWNGFVEAGFAARKESKRLLELAKHAVEVAIERGEEAGMKLL